MIESKRIEAVDILEALESKLAYVPGGRDRENRPLIVVDLPSNELSRAVHSHLKSLIKYFLTIFSEETKKSGLALLVDARSATWRMARAFAREAGQQMQLDHQVDQLSLVVLRPDGFWDKQRVDNYCTKSHGDTEPTLVPLSRLPCYVNPNQLPQNLGGNKPYEHAQWIQNRMQVEEFTADAENLIEKMDDQRRKLFPGESDDSKESDDDSLLTKDTNAEMTNATQRVLHMGRKLSSSMNQESAQDVLDTVKQIHRLIDSIEQKQVEIEKAWSDMDKNLDILKEIENLEEGVATVINWILGPADNMLNSLYQIGYDVSSSEELRIEHEKLELECRETYGKYAEILHKIDSIPKEYLSEDLKSQRDFMDFVCRSFATRLERRRNVLITSQRFFRLVSEYFDKTSEVFDKLIMGSRTCSFSNAGAKLLKLEKSQQKLDALERELVKEGEKLSDILSMPVKDALCRDVQIDYAEDIINVQDILEATNARKNIFSDSVELQKLTLEQIALVYNYETDAEQAICWLNDLFDSLVGDHVEIGCDVSELQSQKQEHQSFQEVARGTYEYGCQLVTGARALRISCKLDLQSNTVLFARLRHVWRQLRSISQEQLTRLRVCAVFHRNVDDHCTQLSEMIDTVGSFLPRRTRSGTPQVRTKSPDAWSIEESTPSTFQLRAKTEIRDVLSKREKLLPEVGRMVRLGRLLRSRLKDPLTHQRMLGDPDELSENGSNLSAVQSISAKLLEVTRLAEKLDARLYEAGARSQPLSPAMEEDNENTNTDIEVGTKKSKDEPDYVATREQYKFEDRPTKDPLEILSRASDRSAVESITSNLEEYVTATECSGTSLPRSRSESFLSCEYEDAPVSTTCRRADDDSTMNIEKHANNEFGTELRTSPTDEEIAEYSRNGATILERTIRDKSGKVMKEVTETTTLRVSHDTHMGVASYKLVSNTVSDQTEHIDHCELQDLERTFVDDVSSCPPPTPPPMPPLKIHHDEHTYTSPTGLVSYAKSIASMGEHCRIDKDEQQLLEAMKSVSDELPPPPSPASFQRLGCNLTIDELVILPSPIVVCEFN
ncbi:hypothetical protein QAD02_023329 [Eretmocerus hayati]|uniref:Uncharacterized protein n=1 Tax=Eretmocerus hayati TaxID=131215 RepID=A0ACC2PVC1_9HYME|nr:hypothetical protein QAD02_023329 [Eretmocerus hayati]